MYVFDCVELIIIFVESGSGGANARAARVSDRASRSKSPAKSFTYRELCIATAMFNCANLIGEGGFGKVFKGRLETGDVSDFCHPFVYS